MPLSFNLDPGVVFQEKEIPQLLGKTPTGDIEKQLTQFRDKTYEACRLKKRLDVHLETLKAEDPLWRQLEVAVQDMTKQAAKLEDQIKQALRRHRETVEIDGVKAEFTNPKTVTHDAAKLMEVHPDAMMIKGLITYAVNEKILESAVAMGHIPQEKADLAKIERPTSSAGRVSIRIKDEA